MTSREQHASDLPTLADERLAELLDGYVEAPAERRREVGDAILRDYPDAGHLLKCLEGLDALMQSGAQEPPAGDEMRSEAATVGPPPATTADVCRQSTPSPEDFPRPFGRYDLLGELGRGGMGVVYLARQVDLGRTVALKMILASELASAEDVRRFYEEARTAARLRHPSIVAIHEVGQIEGQHYFTMEHIEGCSLLKVLRDKPIEPTAAAHLLISIARAVDYLHAHGIVHRDLKPSNILIGPQGEPYLTDFGLAKWTTTRQHLTRTGVVVGTPNYMSPEQASAGAEALSGRSDIFSLGAILYEMLTDRPPFAASNPVDTLLQVMEKDPLDPSQLRPNVPRELARICLRCLEKKPADRYPTAAALAEDLHRYLGGQPIEAGGISTARELGRWARRQPALASRLAGLAVASVITAGAFLWLGAGDPALRGAILGLFAAWAVASSLFQWLVSLGPVARYAPYVWITSDGVLLAVLLSLAQPPIGSLLVGFPVLVVVAGLFFRVRAVWFAALVCVVAYLALLQMRSEPVGLAYHPILVIAMILVTAGVVAYQVYRIRVLGRYFDLYRRW